MSAKSEFTDKARDKAKRAWKYINSTKPVNNNKEAAVPIPAPVSYIYLIIINSAVMSNNHIIIYISSTYHIAH